MRFQSTNLQTVSVWLARLFRMDFTAFQEILGERSATTAAILVVFGASVLAGFGSWFWALQHSNFRDLDSTEVLVKSLLIGSIVQTGVWFIWVYLVYQVLARGYAVRVDFTDLVRTMGFAFAPVSISILVAITSLAVPFGVLAISMAVLFSNAAIEETAGTDTRETTLANLTGLAAFLIGMGIFANIAEVGTFGGLAPGLLFFSLDL